MIAYGQFVADKDINEWMKVEIPLQYKSTSRKPTHIIISAASSMLGDYFTGAAGSKMWIDLSTKSQSIPVLTSPVQGGSRYADGV